MNLWIYILIFGAGVGASGFRAGHRRIVLLGRVS